MRRPALVVGMTLGLVLTMASQAFAAFTFNRSDGTGTLDVADVQSFYGWTKAATKVEAPQVAIEAALGRTAVRTCDDGAQDTFSQYDYLTVNRTLDKIKGKQVYVLQGYPDGGWFPRVPQCSTGGPGSVTYGTGEAFAAWTNWNEHCHNLYDQRFAYGQELPGCPKPPSTLPG